MKKHIYKVQIEYKTDTAHRGAPYTIDGAHYLNHGELIEILVKDALGYRASKEHNTRFDLADDIDEIHASIKSSKSTLTSVRLAETFEETKRAYFERTPSRVWIYAVLDGDNLTTYTMNRDEFSAFLDSFTYWTAQHTIRLKYTSSKVIRWLERAI